MTTIKEPQQQPAVAASRFTRPWHTRAIGQRWLSRIMDGTPWITLRLLTDVAMLTAGCAIGLMLSGSATGAWMLIAFPPLSLILLYQRGRYVAGKRDIILDSLAPGFGAISISTMAVLTAQLAVSGEHGPNSALMAWTWLASIAGVTLAGVALPVIQQGVRRRGLVVYPTLIVGTDVSAQDVARRLGNTPEYGLLPVGFLSNEAPDPESRLPILGTLDELERVVSELSVRSIVIGFPEAPLATMLEFLARCDALGLQTSIAPRFSPAMNSQTHFEFLGTLPLLNLQAFNGDDWRFCVKHGLDRVIAALALVALSPLLIAIAVAIKLSSPGPVLFRQVRAGRDSCPFDLLKFRTMRQADDAQPVFAVNPGLAPGGVEGLDRRTALGRLLRRTSMDELPQLLNVLQGEMSLVGPRPERPEFAECFQRDIERYQDRHRVRAGMTGWAQVHGMRGQTPLLRRVELDNFYIEHWSLGLDVKIMLRTIPALLRGS